MAADLGTEYKAARDRLELAERDAKRVVDFFELLHGKLANDGWRQATLSPNSIVFPKSQRPQSVAFDQWPTKEQAAKAPGDFQDALAEVLRLWAAIPPGERKWLLPPPG